MTPIITTIGNSGARGKVRAPGANGQSIGPGPNAPSWSGKTTYTAVTFDSDVPINPSVGTDGLTGFQGFGTFGGVTPPQTRSEYLTDSTPFGTRRFLRVRYPGSRTALSALDATTASYAYFGSEYYNASVVVTGTWSGTLTFEQSTNGGSSWSAVSLTGLNGSTTGSTTTVNGTWSATTGNTTAVLLRVKATAWTSGTATVDLGFRGGQAPARWRAYSFSGNPRRMYFRWVMRLSSNWTDNGNSGTKGVFFATVPENNHVIMATWGSAINQRIVLQFNVNGGNQDLAATQSTAFGDWVDIEAQIDMGTAGNSDGSIRVWVDGVLVNERLNIKTTNTTYTAGCNALFFDSTYGGGAAPPPDLLTMDTAMVYAETAS